MGLSTAERNRRKRQRKKREKEERRKQEEAEKEAKLANPVAKDGSIDSEGQVEIEYVVESHPATVQNSEKSSSIPDGLPPGIGLENEPQDGNAESMESVLRRFHQRAAVLTAVVSDDEKKSEKIEEDSQTNHSDGEDEYEDDEDRKPMSKRKWREMTRPSVAELKRRVKRPDLVEAHDITAADPAFLIHLKSVPGTVMVPRHWGRKRKYLQGKRGFEKPPFQLPDFIVKTGITEIRDTAAEDEAKQTVKQKNRSRVNPKMGAMDVDYKTLYEAFFRYQTKPSNLTKFGDLYYEGKELETSTDRKPGGPYSKELREACGMHSETSPPPWLVNMQRYGPPPSYPNLSIAGLNAPLPNDRCQYGYHAGGWGKPSVDAYGRPLYGGNPFDPPGSGKADDGPKTGIVTSDGKTISTSAWGGLPTGDIFGGEDEGSEVEESSSEGESSDDDGDDGMDESEEEEEEEGDGIESMLPPAPTTSATAPGDLRKQLAGDETPLVSTTPKQLYKVLEQTTAADAQQPSVFQSGVKYVLPGTGGPSGAESVLSKAVAPNETAKRKRKNDGDDDDDDDLGKKFKF